MISPAPDFPSTRGRHGSLSSEAVGVSAPDSCHRGTAARRWGIMGNVVSGPPAGRRVGGSQRTPMRYVAL